MVVQVASRTVSKGSVTPAALDVETDVVSIVAQGEIYMVEGYLDLVNLEAADVLVVREYISADDANERQYATNSYSGSQSGPIVRFHTKTTQGPYKVTIEQTAGIERAVLYWFVREQMEVT